MFSVNISTVCCLALVALVSTAPAASDTISGVVTDSATRFAVSQVTVASEGRTTTTDANGSFCLIFPQTNVFRGQQAHQLLLVEWDPGNGSLSCLGNLGEATIAVSTIRGGLVASGRVGLGERSVSIGHLPAGIYTVMISSHGQTLVVPFLNIGSKSVLASTGFIPTDGASSAVIAKSLATGQAHSVVFTKTGYAVKIVQIPAGTKDSIGVRLHYNSGIGGKSYFVSPGGNDFSNNGLSTNAPYQTLQKAHDVMVAGDTCKAMPGTYNYSGSGECLVITRSGSAQGHIHYQAYDMANRPVIKLNLAGSGTSTYVGWGAIKVKGASYIDISGFILVGANDNLDIAKGEEVRAYYMAEKAKNNGFADCNWQYVSTTNTNGISIDKNGTAFVNHLTISNCDISKFAGCGIGLSNADYALIDNNVCHDNSWYTLWPTSGITVSTGYNSDSYVGFKTIVSNNVCFNNKAFVKWEYNGEYTDGNGIIADVNRGDIINPVSPTETYNGKTLFVNNICYNNGGSGLHSYGAVNVWFVNNIAWNNAIRSAEQGVYANIFANDSPNNRFINNISIAGTGRKNFDQYLSSGTTWSNCFYFGGGSNNGIGSGISQQDPRFAGPFTSLTTNIANSFRVGASSPCIDAGFPFPSFANDLDGNERPLRGGYDIGAFELP